MDDAAAVELRDASLDVRRGAMTLLLGWSAGNLAVGGLGALTTRSPEARAFAGGSAAWNTVNAGIAAASLASLPRARAETDPSAIRRQARGLEAALAVNAGLDVAYVGAGVGMWAAGKRAGRPTLAGLGEALVLQGAFLLAFDSATLARHRAATR